MEPVCVLKDFVPVKVLRGRFGDRGMSPVVNHLGRPLGSAFFQEINADAVSAADNAGGIDSKFSQFIYSGLSDFVGGKLRNKSRVDSEIGQGYGHVGFSSAVGGAKGICLYKAVIALGGKTEHDFSERDHSFCHNFVSPSCYGRFLPLGAASLP